MPIYEYEHISKYCSKGKIFELKQSLSDNPLTRCPLCAGTVKKCLSLSNISTPKTNSELRDLGFTKLVRREDGVYENVTCRDGDNRYMRQGKPETIPNLKKIIKD